MSRGKHKWLAVSQAWWPKLVDRYQSWGYRTLEDFCADNPKLSARVIKDAWKNGKMTERSFDYLAEQLGYGTRRELLDAWGGTGETAVKSPLSPESSRPQRQGPVRTTAIPVEHRAIRTSPDQNPGDPATRQTASRRSLAVLPFVNMSQREDEEYLSDGLSDDIINLLAKVPERSVTGHTSSFAFLGKTQDIRMIAERLNVAMILEGSVRRDGSRLRITTQLINAGDGYTVWSERYDRKLSNVFAVQDEIAGAIASALKVNLAASSALHTEYTPILPAYEACKKGWYQFFKATPKSIARSREYFERAVTLDPKYALAHVALSNYFLLAALTGVGPAPKTCQRPGWRPKRRSILTPGCQKRIQRLLRWPCPLITTGQARRSNFGSLVPPVPFRLSCATIARVSISCPRAASMKPSMI